jgi:D-alanyl-D-alanine carboxypeptidase
MNERAGSLGLAHTRFANPAGNDDPENYSTARDVATLGEFIAQHHSELWRVSQLSQTVVTSQSGRSYHLENTNPLLEEYPGIYGSKTGLDEQARGTLVFLYQIAPQDIIVAVLLKSEDRFGDERKLLGWLESNFTIAADRP